MVLGRFENNKHNIGKFLRSIQGWHPLPTHWVFWVGGQFKLMVFAAFLEIFIIFELPRKTHLPTHLPNPGSISRKFRNRSILISSID
jgi:hypothetical protein